MMENAYLLGAGLAIGLAGLGVCLGEGSIAKKAMEVVGKNPELSGKVRTFAILGMAITESAAIYGLIVAIMIVTGGNDLGWMQSMGAGLAVGLAGLGAGIGEGYVATKALEALHRNPKNEKEVMNFMILFIALVESAAIYGLIVSLMIVL